MSKRYGQFKMLTTENIAFAEKLSDLVDVLKGEDVKAVFEYNSVCGKYNPNTSAFKWLCAKRGQTIAEDTEGAKRHNVNSLVFSEMVDLMEEMGYTAEEKRNAIDGFMRNLPIKRSRNSF